VAADCGTKPTPRKAAGRCTCILFPAGFPWHRLPDMYTLRASRSPMTAKAEGKYLSADYATIRRLNSFTDIYRAQGVQSVPLMIAITVDLAVLARLPAARAATVSDYGTDFADVALCIATGINVYVSILIMTWLPDFRYYTGTGD